MTASDKANLQPWYSYSFPADGTKGEAIAFLVGPRIVSRDRSTGFSPDDADLIVKAVNVYRANNAGIEALEKCVQWWRDGGLTSHANTESLFKDAEDALWQHKAIIAAD